MAINKYRAEAEIVLDGIVRKMRVNYATIARIEDTTGVSILSGEEAGRAQKMSRVSFVLAMISEALATAGTKLDSDELSELLEEPGKFVEATEKCGELLRNFIERVMVGSSAVESPSAQQKSKPVKTAGQS